MKIILPDAKTVTNGDLSLEPLREFGEVIVRELTPYDQIAEAVRDADMIICNKTPLNAETLRYADRLKYIGLFATGYNNIDIEYCRAHGITVCNAGSYSTNAVCQHTFALILECLNRVGSYNSFVHDGGWKKSRTFSPFVFPLNEIADKTLGIIGYGSIGKAVEKVALAFGMKTLKIRRHDESDPSFVALDTLLNESDIITVHCPLNDSSYRMINRDTIAKMKDGAIFINTARGGVMDENAVADALKSGKLSYAGIDVLEVEPMAPDNPLCEIENCIITPHIAWAPMETRERLMGIVCDNIRGFINGEPRNVVS